jgi:restriction endonuclease S subunit
VKHWTIKLNIEKILANFELVVRTQAGIQQIRDLVLELAMNGLLTNQNKENQKNSGPKKPPLPDSWKLVKIEEVSDFVNGFAFRSDEYTLEGVGVVRMSDMKGGEIVMDDMKYVSPEKMKSIDKAFQIHPNDIVLGMTGATLGRPCVNRTSKTFLLNQRIGKLVPRAIDPDYFFLALTSLEKIFMKLSFGTGVNNLSTKQIKDSFIPLPPEEEQKRIVFMVRELFNICDQLEVSINRSKNYAELSRRSAISAISNAQTQADLLTGWLRVRNNWEVLTENPNAISSLRKLILSFAAKGKLVNNPDRFSKNSSKMALHEVCKVSWGNLSLTKSSYVDDGQFLAVSAAGPDGRINFAEYKALTPVLSAIGARCGTMFMPKEDFTAIKNTMTFQPNEDLIHNWYLLYTLMGSELPKRGSAQPFISKSDIEKFQIRVPSLKEQELVYSRVEDLLKECDLLEAKLNEAQGLSERLTKSLISGAA